MNTPWEKRVFVIAELGKNFIQTKEEKSVEEYLENAKELVRLAKEAGADAVKFQSHNVEDEQLNIYAVSPHFTGADRYNWVSRNNKSTPFNEFWKPLKEYCDEIGILFHTTPMSRGSAQIIQKLNPTFWKVASPDNTDYVLLDYLSTLGKPVILSSGMSTLEEMDKSVEFMKKRGVNITMLHCVSKYPCPPEQLNLATIAYLRERYKIPIGFSDHSIGIDSGIAAAALGACIIEKHFSLRRDLWGADHKVSMTPEELAQMVKGIRKLETDPAERERWLRSDKLRSMLGEHGKIIPDGEFSLREYFRKSLMAGKDIPAGTILTKELIYAMRPQKFAGGLPSERYEHVLGRKTTKALKKYDPITEVVFE